MGCKNQITKTVVVHPLPISDFNSSTDEIDVLYNHVDFVNLSQGASSYEWYFDSLGMSTSINSQFDYQIDVPCRTFENKLIAISQYGCKDSVMKVLNTKGNLAFYTPTSFTPDGDGINDFFGPVFKDVSPEGYVFQIFDRWGTLIFETSDIYSQWDGTQGNIALKQDVYVWKVSTKVVCNNELHKHRGHVTLIR